MKIRNYTPYDSPDSYGLLEAFINKSRVSRKRDARRMDRNLRRFAHSI